jgi:DNA-binding SARP family transcriptional activator
VNFRVELLGGFSLFRIEQRVCLPSSGQRVIAYLALQRRPISRLHLASSLWLDGTEARANSNLRTALWKIRDRAPELVSCRGSTVELESSVEIDLHSMIAQSKGLSARLPEATIGPDPSLFSRELLPDWDEEWLVLERERVRQIRMHALEALCISRTAAGRYADAIDAGLAAVEAEPLRESAQRALVAAHLAEGNLSEAVRTYDTYRHQLEGSLGIKPSPEFEALIHR